MDAPQTLGPIAAAKWDELCSRLRSANGAELPSVLAGLEIYCSNYQRWVEAQRWLDEHGDVLEIVNDKGVVLRTQPAPKLEVAARAEKTMQETMRIIASRFI